MLVFKKTTSEGDQTSGESSSISKLKPKLIHFEEQRRVISNNLSDDESLITREKNIFIYYGSTN